MITEPVAVAEGVSLTVQPGTRIKFAPGAYIETRGPVSMVGAADSPIVIKGGDIRLHADDAVVDLAYAEDGSYLAGLRFEHVDMADGDIRSDAQRGRNVYLRNVVLGAFVVEPELWSPDTHVRWGRSVGSYFGYSTIGNIGGSTFQGSELEPNHALEPVQSRFEHLTVEHQLFLMGRGANVDITRCSFRILSITGGPFSGDFSNNLPGDLWWREADGGSLHGNRFADQARVVVESDVVSRRRSISAATRGPRT